MLVIGPYGPSRGKRVKLFLNFSMSLVVHGLCEDLKTRICLTIGSTYCPSLEGQYSPITFSENWLFGTSMRTCYFLKEDSNLFNLWSHLLLNNCKDSSLQCYQFLYPLAIQAAAFDVMVQLYNHRGVKN